jgi:metal-dependent amidase/aminoacylase/carboxypeptidase family protein
MLLLKKLYNLRYALHAHPEVSGEERATAARIEAHLNDLKPDALLTGLGGHGILATFDSGIFTSRFPCCMFGLGAGEDTPALHSPDYDFPDAIVESGCECWGALLGGQWGRDMTSYTCTSCDSAYTSRCRSLCRWLMCFCHLPCA